MADQTIEIELQLQDKATETIQQIARSVSEVVKHLGELGKASAGTDSGVTRAAKSVKDLDDKTKDTNKALTALSATMARMAGPAGVAILIGTGLVAAAQALDGIAGKRLRFENLSTDLGFTVDQMSVMIKTFQLMGMSSEEAKSRLVAIGTSLRDLQKMGQGSEIYRTLSQMGRNEFAKQLVEATKSADGLYRGFQMINEEFNRITEVEGPRAASLFLQTINGMSKSIAQQFAEKSKGVHPERQVDKDVAAEFHKNKQDLKDATQDFINRWAEFFQEQSNKFSKFMGGLSGMEIGSALGGVVGSAYNMFDKSPLGHLHPFTKSAPTEPNSSRSLGGTRRRGAAAKEEEDKKESNSTLEKIRDSIKNLFGATPKQYGGPVEAGQSYLVGEVRPEIYIGGGETHIVGIGGPQIIQPQSPGMISASADFPAYMPNRFSPQISMPSFETRFGDWNPSSFGGRFGDWGSSSVGERFGNWNTSGGGSRPAEPYEGGGGGGSSLDSFLSDRSQLDINLSAEEHGSPSLNAEIIFKNVPAGVDTKANGDGFDNFTVNKSKALY